MPATNKNNSESPSNNGGDEGLDVRILYVDDEPKALKYFEKSYGREFDIAVAQSAAEAIEILKAPGSNVGVLLTDQRMPRKSGVDLLRQVHAQWPDIVSLLITAYLDIDDAIIAINQGHVFKYISKPFQSEHMKICLLEALHEHTKRRTSAQLAEAHDLLKKAHESKGEFINMLSHEVRTPISITKNLADLLLKTPLTDIQRQHVTAMKAVNENVANLLDNTLDHSKWQAGELKLSRIEFSLDILLNQLRQTFDAQAEIAGLRYQVKNDTNLSAMLLGDRDRLLQVLINLVGNAIKFTPSGGSITVTAHVIEQTPDSLSLGFSVKDTGTGMDSQSLEKLFKPFSQAQQEKRGTGLGLYISKKLVGAMGGAIDVKSEPGRGSEFWFTVAMEKSEPSDSLFGLGGDKPVAPILLADDNRINLFYVLKLLSDEGYEVDTADDGRQALSMAMGKRYSAIIIDCQMPHMTGFEVASRIRSGGCNETTPIVAFTAMSKQAFDERVQESGIDDCITKPFNSQALLEKIGTWIRKDKSASSQAS